MSDADYRKGAADLTSIMLFECVNHEPVVACIGDLLWCKCSEPDWESLPAPAEGQEVLDRWAVRQRFYEPSEFVPHVIAAIAGGLPA